MSGITHQRDTRISMIWGNVEAPVTNGTPVTPDFDKTTSLTALTSLALPVENFTVFSLNPNQRRLSRQTGKRHRSLYDTWNDTKGSIPGVTLSMPANLDILDLFLAMSFQRCLEGSTPFVKTFQYPDITQLSFAAGRYPDFEANEGFFCGLVFSSLSSALSSSEEIIVGCVPTQLRFTCESDKHDGQPWMEIDLIGRYVDTGAGYTGTITDYTTEYAKKLHINDLGVRTVFGATNIGIYGFGFTIDTGLVFVPFGGTGGGGSTNCSMNGPNATFFVDFLADDTGSAFFASQRSEVSGGFMSQFINETNKISWGDGTVSADGEMDITWQGQVSNFAPVGSEEMRFRIDWDCAEYSSNDALKVVLCNGLDRGW